ncbi:MAG TPA: VWA domain-containing protein [Candidatus Eisenbacteria bacterium]|nr:VWA domain-containing protein [Candidatus Eisenbacteria bacterium]
MKSRYALYFGLTVILVSVVTCTASFGQDQVRVAVSATSAGNTPVMDLTKGEFTVQDSGKAQAIATFAGPETKSPPPPPLKANEFTNIPDFREASGAVFVVFDTIDTRYIDESDARSMVLKFLAKAAQAKHAVTLAILSSKGLTVYHDYREGSDVLLAALAKSGLGGMKGVAPPAGVDDTQVNAEAARLTAFSKGDLSNAAAEGQLLHPSIDAVLTMLQDVGWSAAGLPGRKALVWVTNAVPFDMDPKTMEFKSPQITSRGVAVGGETTVGPGVTAGLPGGVAVGGSKDQLTTAEVKRLSPIWRETVRALFDGGVAVYPYEVRGASNTAANTLSQIRMKTLATLTGGKAFFGSNDPFPELLSISNGNTAGYVLGYAGEAVSNPGFRRVEVMAIRANVEVTHAAGYFPYEGSVKARLGDETGVAMTSPLEYTGIPFRITVAGMEEGSGGKKKVNLVIAIPGSAGILNEAAGTVDVGFVANAINAAGRPVGTMNEGAGGKFNAEQMAHIKQLGFQLKRSFEVSPGECSVRFVVRDNQSGRMGDVIFPLNVK